jgi:hypothetical protein
MGITMRKYSLLLAVMLAASFSTVADAAKKKAGGVAPDPVYQWNVEHMPPQGAPAKKAKKMANHRHHGAKKMAKKKS